MIYGLLSNKTQKTYVKFFKMIKDVIKVYPNAININFEKAVMNSKVYFNIQMSCLWLLLSFLKKVQEKNLIGYAPDDQFRLYYKLMQGLAFVPEIDVVEEFLMLQQSSPAKFSEKPDYLEVYYIGKIVPLSRKIREKPTFPIPTWNLYLGTF